MKAKEAPGSLKSELRELASLLGTTEAALYERVRTLVRAGALEQNGQGPGRGVRASSAAVARLVLAHLATLRPIEIALCIAHGIEGAPSAKPRFTGGDVVR